MNQLFDDKKNEMNEELNRFLQKQEKKLLKMRIEMSDES